jgi:hypothetical protein
MIKLFLIIVFVLLTQILAATIRFVSKTGSSTPQYTIWATVSNSIQKCINICVDGDTVVVANGVYKESLIIYNARKLVIEPGATLNFYGGAKLVIEGKLIANGSTTNNQINLYNSYLVSVADFYRFVSKDFVITNKMLMLK